MLKSNMRAVLGLSLALASGALILAGPASAQSFYVASGENAGGSVGERAAVLSGTQASSIVTQRRAAQPTWTFHGSAMHAYADGRSHHADPDSRVVAQLERDCPALHW